MIWSPALQGGFYVAGSVADYVRGVSSVGVVVAPGGSGLGDGYEAGAYGAVHSLRASGPVAQGRPWPEHRKRRGSDRP